VRQLREFNLQFALEASRTLRKNIQNQTVTIQYSTAGEFLEIALLARTQGLIDENDVRGIQLSRLANLLGLAAAYEVFGIWARACCEHRGHAHCARGCG
jgi:hypothetical protein